jgi:hypothetical protein
MLKNSYAGSIGAEVRTPWQVVLSDAPPAIPHGTSNLGIVTARWAYPILAVIMKFPLLLQYASTF